jgi:hypothetical protein
MATKTPVCRLHPSPSRWNETHEIQPSLRGEGNQQKQLHMHGLVHRTKQLLEPRRGRIGGGWRRCSDGTNQKSLCEVVINMNSKYSILYTNSCYDTTRSFDTLTCTTLISLINIISTTQRERERERARERIAWNYAARSCLELCGQKHTPAYHQSGQRFPHDTR